MSDLDADDERAGEAAAKLADGLKSCRSVLKSYRIMLGEHPAVDPQPDPPMTEAEAEPRR